MSRLQEIISKRATKQSNNNLPHLQRMYCKGQVQMRNARFFKKISSKPRVKALLRNRATKKSFYSRPCTLQFSFSAFKGTLPWKISNVGCSRNQTLWHICDKTTLGRSFASLPQVNVNHEKVGKKISARAQLLCR